ncbi:Uncharacterised protein [Escherichia coli]|nr:Uncharacterised protein [Escherichia coli]CAD5705421.1 Uncharacterised protein [Escherichia coli]
MLTFVNVRLSEWCFLKLNSMRCVFTIVILTGPLFKRASLNSEVLPRYSDAVIQNSFIRVSVLLVYFVY